MFLFSKLISLVFEGFHTATRQLLFATVSHFALPAEKNILWKLRKGILRWSPQRESSVGGSEEESSVGCVKRNPPLEAT
jgi:hypothetical protein